LSYFLEKEHLPLLFGLIILDIDIDRALPGGEIEIECDYILTV
jgi:hypothetical protein